MLLEKSRDLQKEIVSQGRVSMLSKCLCVSSFCLVFSQQATSELCEMPLHCFSERSGAEDVV